MVKQEEKEVANHTVVWLSWKQIQKKYPNKWVSLGCKNANQLENNEIDILGVADTFDEILEFNSKYSDAFWETKQYVMFTTRSTQIIKKSKKLVFPIYATIVPK